MKARMRATGWSSAEEHFRYDYGARCFVLDEAAAGDSHIVENGRKGLKEYATVLEALSELRREFETRAADEWESGHLLTLYGASTAAVDAVEVARRREAVSQKWHEPRDYCSYVVERFLGETIYVCEIAITRHWPDALPRLEAEIFDNSPNKAGRLNSALRLIGLQTIPRIHAIVDLWLSSFDKPRNYFVRRDTTDVELEIISLWMEVCIGSVRRLLVNSAPAIREGSLESNKRTVDTNKEVL